MRPPICAVGVLAAALAACGAYIVPDRFYVVEAEEGVRLAARPGCTVVDLRPPADFSVRHAAGALSIPLSQLWARMDELPASQNALIVIYDDDPDRALRAGSLLRREGYVRVYISRGGLAAWEAANGPVDSGEPPRPGLGRGVESWQS